MTTTNKVLAGCGIGCLAVVLICFGLVVAGGFWVKGKVENVVARGEAMKKDETRAKELDAKFAFAEPKGLEPVALTKDRVDLYLEVRKELDAVQAKYDPQLKKITDKKHKKDVGFGDVMAAGGAMLDMMQEQRGKFLDALEARKMSPKEFHAITRSIRAARLGLEEMDVNRGRRESLEMMRDNAIENAKDSKQPKASRDFWTQQANQYAAELKALPPPPTPSDEAIALNDANKKLIEGYAEAIPENGFGPDVTLPGGSDSLMAESMSKDKAGADGIGSQNAYDGPDDLDTEPDVEPGDDSADTAVSPTAHGKKESAHAPAP